MGLPDATKSRFMRISEDVLILNRPVDIDGMLTSDETLGCRVVDGIGRGCSRQNMSGNVDATVHWRISGDLEAFYRSLGIVAEGHFGCDDYSSRRGLAGIEIVKIYVEDSIAIDDRYRRLRYKEAIHSHVGSLLLPGGAAT